MKIIFYVGANKGMVKIFKLIVQSLALQLMLGTITVGVVFRLFRWW
jgi:hypothetical protein